MLSLRYILRLFQAFFYKFRFIIAISVIAGIFLFLLAYVFLPNLWIETRKVGLVGRYQPGNLPDEISSQISRGLTKVDQDGSVIGDIAKSWETVDGGKTWKFFLNDNLYWNDKKKLTSKDIEYNFTDASFEKTSDFELTFKLESEFSAFPVIVSKPVFKKGLVGLGEYKVEKINMIAGNVQSLHIIKERKERIIYKFYPTEERLKLAFKLGEVDEISKISSSLEFANWKTVDVSKFTAFNNFVALFINLENEKFKDKEVRQAIAYAIDKDKFNEDRAVSPISPFSWSYNPQVKPYQKDLSKSEAIKEMRIKISTMPNLLDKAEIMKTELENAGALVEIETTPNIPSNYDLFLATVDIPKDPDQYILWHSTQEKTNISKIKNPRIDKLLEDGRKELDIETRRKLYIDFQRFLVEEVPAVFLYHPSYYNINRK